MIHILLVDDHNLVRAGVRAMLESSAQVRIMGEADCGEDALLLATEHPIQVAVLDIHMPGMPVLELIQKLRSMNPPVYSVILSSSHDENFISQLLNGGACGYVTKQCEDTHLLTAIQKAVHGERYFSPDIAKRLAYQALTHSENSVNHPENLLDLLSEREMETLSRLAKGKTVKEIAEEFGVHPKTVNTYRHRIFNKLQVSNDVELIKLIARSNLLEKDHDESKT